MSKFINSSILHGRDTFEYIAFAKKNVVGVGIGEKVSDGKSTGEIAVVAFVEKKQPYAALGTEQMLPRTVLGVPTDVVEVGRIEALATKIQIPSRTDKWRPAPGGVSIGHYKITAGTLGTYVKDNLSGKTVILSNNHVLANSNDAKFGDPIYQPGPVDGGKALDMIGRLIRFVPISFGEDDPTCDLAESWVRFSNWLAEYVFNSSHRVSAKRVDAQATNFVDAAIAEPVSDDVIDGSILDLGVISGTEEGYLGMKVAKSGRTTETTFGTITHVNATIQVSYGAGKVATFRDQYLSGYMSKGGDSGSLLVSNEDEKNRKAVGLLFAGSSSTTVYNPISHVLSALNITI